MNRKRQKSMVSLFLVLTMALMIFSGCGSNNKPDQQANASKPASTSESASNLTEITLATVGDAAVYGPIYYAQEKDMWKDYGLKVKLASFTASAATAALVAGSVNIVYNGPSVVEVAVKTDKVKVIGTISKVAMSIYTKDLKNLEDLKGKTIGVSGAGGSIDTAARSLVKSIGLTPDTDVKFLYTSNNPATLAALSEGKIDAGVLSPPSTASAEGMGLKELANLNKAKGILGQYAFLGVNQDFSSKNQKAVQAFMNALSAAVKKSKEDKEATKAAIGKYTKTTDETVLESSFNAYKDIWYSDLHIPADEVQVILDNSKNLDSKNKKPSEIMDNQFADAVK